MKRSFCYQEIKHCSITLPFGTCKSQCTLKPFIQRKCFYIRITVLSPFTSRWEFTAWCSTWRHFQKAGIFFFKPLSSTRSPRGLHILFCLEQGFTETVKTIKLLYGMQHFKFYWKFVINCMFCSWRILQRASRDIKGDNMVKAHNYKIVFR